MRPYLTHGSGPGDTAGEEIAAPFVRMETMSADPPTPRTRTVPRRAGVIPPIIKLLSCGWHPRATRGTRPGLRFSSRPHSACSPCSPLLSPYSPFPPLVPSCRLPICPVLVDPRWLSDKTKTCASLASWCARTHDSEQIAGSVSLNLVFSSKKIKNLLVLSIPCEIKNLNLLWFKKKLLTLKKLL